MKRTSVIVPTGVIHGRFQLPHNDHLAYLLAGRARCRHLVVGITNPDPTLTRPESVDVGRSTLAANPFTYYDRYRMVRAALDGAGVAAETFSIVPFPINLPELYRFYVPVDATYFLTIYDQWGERKRRMFTSLGLKVEVLWQRPLSEKGLSGSEIRNRIRCGQPWEHLVPPAVVPLVRELSHRLHQEKLALWGTSNTTGRR